jgi:replicative DNA helicase
MYNEPLVSPQSIEAEQSLLGGILLDPDSLLIASDVIDPSDFYRESHRMIFSACMDLYQLGEQIDLITLSERLKTQQKLDAVGGISYLSALVNFSPTATNVKYHADIIKRKAILRRVKAWAANLLREADEGVEDLQAWFGRAQEVLVEIEGNVSVRNNPYAGNIISAIKQKWNEMKAGKMTFAPTDYKFNAVIPGYFPKHFWIIGGYTSNGKSTLLTQILVDTCSEGLRPLIFSLEDSREEKLMKLISNLTDISQVKLVIGDIEGHEQQIAEAEELIRKWDPIYYDDIYDLDEIRLKTKKHKLQDGINLVAVDYCQNVIGKGDLYQDMRALSMMLDKIKKDLSITVIALSQVTNESVKTNSEVIGLKGAGELASAADIVLWLRRVKGEGKERFLDCEIRKNRPFGATGIVPLIFSEKWTRIDRRSF